MSPNGYILGESKTLIDKSNLFKLNHSFEGWYDNPTFAGNRITEIKSTDRGNKVFYAKWSNNYVSTDYLNILRTDTDFSIVNNQYVYNNTEFVPGNVWNFAKSQLLDSIGNFLIQLLENKFIEQKEGIIYE